MAPEDVNTTRRFLSRSAPVTALAVASLFLVQCERKPEPPPQPAAPVVEPAPPPKPIVVAPPPPLGRADILAALAAAASAYAAGEAPSADPLAGRAFAIRLPFGCGGPAAAAAPDGLAQWAWGAKQETIKLSLTPADWTKSPLIAATEGQTPWEAAEGFWIARPWMTSETCPAAFGSAAPGGEAAASPQTAGLVAVFDAAGSRFGRRNGRAYSFTVRPSGETPLTLPDRGYRVLLEGRVGAFPDGRAIRCRADGPDQRPVCVAAIQLDRVAFEDGASGATLSEWRKG